LVGDLPRPTFLLAVKDAPVTAANRAYGGAQLDELSLGDALRKAVELYVETKQSEPDFASKAAAALEEIEREAAARRGAIQALFGQSTSTEEAKPAGRRRGGDASV
jgi:Flp pilus assembly protein TadD